MVEALTREEQLQLSHLFQDPSWHVYLKCLRMEELLLVNRMFEAKTGWEEVLALRGRREMLKKIGQIPKRVELALEEQKGPNVD